MRRMCAAWAVALVLGAAGCASGDESMKPGGEFTFVSPGGKTHITYAPEERGRVDGLSGESLLEPGKRIRLSDFAGQVVVLNLWGSWCGPCRGEVDDLQAVQDKTADQGVRVLGVDVRDDRSAAADFVRDRELTYPSIYDPSGRSLLALEHYPRSAVPSTVILDRQHRVAAIHLTPLLESDLLPEVRAIAAEK